MAYNVNDEKKADLQWLFYGYEAETFNIVASIKIMAIM